MFIVISGDNNFLHCALNRQHCGQQLAFHGAGPMAVCIPNSGQLQKPFAESVTSTYR